MYLFLRDEELQKEVTLLRENSKRFPCVWMHGPNEGCCPSSQAWYRETTRTTLLLAGWEWPQRAPSQTCSASMRSASRQSWQKCAPFHFAAFCMHTSRCRGAEQAVLLPQQVAAAAQAEAARQRLFTAGKRAYEYGQVTRLSHEVYLVLLLGTGSVASVLGGVLG